MQRLTAMTMNLSHHSRATDTVVKEGENLSIELLEIKNKIDDLNLSRQDDTYHRNGLSIGVSLSKLPDWFSWKIEIHNILSFLTVSPRIFSCEDAAQQVLMSVRLSVCPSVRLWSTWNSVCVHSLQVCTSMQLQKNACSYISLYAVT